MQALIDLENKVNVIHLFFAKQLGFPIRPTDIGEQKINSITQDIHRIVVTAYLVVDKVNRIRFFQETFLMANVSPEVVFKMLFLTMSNVDADFSGWELQ